MCKKGTVIYLLLFIYSGIAAQSGDKLIPAPGINFKWPAVEKRISTSVLKHFVNQQPDEFTAYRDTARYMENIDSLYKQLHAVDINNDGLDDIIFEGKYTGEGSLVQIFMNTGKLYKKVFEDRQGITKMEWDNRVLSTLWIEDWGCCADYVEFKKKYSIQFQPAGASVFTQVYQAAEMFDGTKPDSLFADAFAFEVLNSDYKLRAQPVIDDTSMFPWQEGDTLRATGNYIGKLTEGSIGTALGKKTDITGREWWYVEIDEKYPLQKSAFYDNENKFPTKTRGWLSSRFLRRL